MLDPFLAILSHSPLESAWCFASQASHASREANGMIGRSGLAVIACPLDNWCYGSAAR
jgi:hypothetical protein